MRLDRLRRKLGGPARLDENFNATRQGASKSGFKLRLPKRTAGPLGHQTTGPTTRQCAIPDPGAILLTTLVGPNDANLKRSYSEVTEGADESPSGGLKDLKRLIYGDHQRLHRQVREAPRSARQEDQERVGIGGGPEEAHATESRFQR